MATRRPTQPPAKKATTRRAPARKVAAKKKAAAKPAPPKKRSAPPASKRDDQVLKLHHQGLTFEEIAKKLRIRDAAGAHTAYERALAKALPDPPETTKRAELERMRAAEEELWPKAERGDLAAITKLVSLDLERQVVSRDQLHLTNDRSLGPVEKATLDEVRRLSEAAPALAATALILARAVDDTDEPGPKATVSRELRMHMSQLRGLAGTNPKFDRAPAPPSDGDDGKKKPKKGGEVVPETKLEQLRMRAAQRAREVGKQ